MHILLIHKSGLLNLELSNQFKSYYGRKSLQTSDGYYINKICTIWNFFSYYTNCKNGQVVYRIAVGFLKGCNRP